MKIIMVKTKLGLTPNAYAALIFGIALLGGIIPALLLAGAALLLEENEWLKRMSVKAIAFLVMVKVVSVILMFLPDVLQWIADIILIFAKRPDLEVIDKITSIFNWINKAFHILVSILWIVYAYQAYNGKYAKVLFVENMVNKNM